MNIQSPVNTHLSLQSIHVQEFPPFDSSYFKISTIHSVIHVIKPKHVGYDESNVVLIELNSGIILIDSFISPKANAQLIAFVEKHLHKPIQYLINSHSHIDHLMGYLSFNSNIPILAGVQSFKHMSGKGFSILKQWANNMKDSFHNIVMEYINEENPNSIECLEEVIKLFQLSKMSNFNFRLPNLLIEDHIYLTGDKISVDIQNVGPAFTEEDLIIQIPELKTAFLGPLLCQGCLNASKLVEFVQQANSLNNIINILTKIAKDDINIFLSSSGKVWEKCEVLEFREMLIHLQENSHANLLKITLHQLISFLLYPNL